MTSKKLSIAFVNFISLAQKTVPCRKKSCACRCARPRVPEPFAVDDLEDLPPFIQRVGPGRGRVAADGNRLSQSPAPAVDTGPLLRVG